MRQPIAGPEDLAAVHNGQDNRQAKGKAICVCANSNAKCL